MKINISEIMDNLILSKDKTSRVINCIEEVDDREYDYVKSINVDRVRKVDPKLIVTEKHGPSIIFTRDESGITTSVTMNKVPCIKNGVYDVDPDGNMDVEYNIVRANRMM